MLPGDSHKNNSLRLMGRCVAIQMGGVLKVLPFPQGSAYRKRCNTNWRRTATPMEVVLQYFFEK